MFLLRALAVWLVIMWVEFIHGVLRAMSLAPLVGDFQARQISVLSGSLLILTIAYLFVRWIRADSTGAPYATPSQLRGGDLHTVSATSLFDRELERGRLAVLRERSKLGAVAARIKQGCTLATSRW